MYVCLGFDSLCVTFQKHNTKIHIKSHNLVGNSLEKGIHFSHFDYNRFN